MEGNLDICCIAKNRLDEKTRKSTTIHQNVCNHIPSGLFHQYFLGVSASTLYAAGVGMQIHLCTNKIEFEFAPNLHEFVDPPKLQFPT